AAAVPPLAAIAYLVDQCHTLDETAFSSGISTRPFNQRLAWMLDMFERVEARRQDERHGAHRSVAAEAGQRLSH
ncbi:MAG: hypothetical protein U1E02_36220, partial [Hydrogenophaga sp.]|nr:hypothetical protein [Hydrogenophaga sp.]